MQILLDLSQWFKDYISNLLLVRTVQVDVLLRRVTVPMKNVLGLVSKGLRIENVIT